MSACMGKSEVGQRSSVIVPGPVSINLTRENDATRRLFADPQAAATDNRFSSTQTSDHHVHRSA